MPIEVAELNEWIATDEGKGWLNNQTADLRTKLGTAEGKVTELSNKNETLNTSVQELTTSNEKLNIDLEKALTGQAEPNEELQSQIQVLTTNLGQAQEQTSKLQKQILNEKLSNLINDEIVKQGGNPKVLGIHVRRQLAAELTEEGQLSVFAIDEQGKKAFDAEAKPAGVGYVVSQLKQDDAFKASFKAPVKSGSGHVDPEDPNPSKVNQKSFLDMDAKELGDMSNLQNALFAKH